MDIERGRFPGKVGITSAVSRPVKGRPPRCPDATRFVTDEAQWNSKIQDLLPGKKLEILEDGRGDNRSLWTQSCFVATT